MQPFLWDLGSCGQADQGQVSHASAEGRSAGIKQEARISRLVKKADHVATEHRKEKLAAVSDWRPFSYMRGLQVYSFPNFLMPPRKLLVEICFHLWEDWKNEGQTVTEHLAIRKRVQRRGNCSSRI